MHHYCLLAWLEVYKCSSLLSPRSSSSLSLSFRNSTIQTSSTRTAHRQPIIFWGSRIFDQSSWIIFHHSHIIISLDITPSSAQIFAKRRDRSSSLIPDSNTLVPKTSLAEKGVYSPSVAACAQQPARHTATTTLLASFWQLPVCGCSFRGAVTAYKTSLPPQFVHPF